MLVLFYLFINLKPNQNKDQISSLVPYQDGVFLAIFLAIEFQVFNSFMKF